MTIDKKILEDAEIMPESEIIGKEQRAYENIHEIRIQIENLIRKNCSQEIIDSKEKEIKILRNLAEFYETVLNRRFPYER